MELFVRKGYDDDDAVDAVHLIAEFARFELAGRGLASTIAEIRDYQASRRACKAR